MECGRFITSLSNILPKGANKTEEYAKLRLSEHVVSRENFEAKRASNVMKQQTYTYKHKRMGGGKPLGRYIGKVLVTF